MTAQEKTTNEEMEGPGGLDSRTARAEQEACRLLLEDEKTELFVDEQDFADQSAASPAAVQKEEAKSMERPKGKHRGRPKGSKNKKTLERLAREAEMRALQAASQQPAVQQEAGPLPPAVPKPEHSRLPLYPQPQSPSPEALQPEALPQQGPAPRILRASSPAPEGRQQDFSQQEEARAESRLPSLEAADASGASFSCPQHPWAGEPGFQPKWPARRDPFAYAKRPAAAVQEPEPPMKEEAPFQQPQEEPEEALNEDQEDWQENWREEAQSQEPSRVHLKFLKPDEETSAVTLAEAQNRLRARLGLPGSGAPDTRDAPAAFFASNDGIPCVRDSRIQEEPVQDAAKDAAEADAGMKAEEADACPVLGACKAEPSLAEDLSAEAAPSAAEGRLERCEEPALSKDRDDEADEGRQEADAREQGRAAGRASPACDVDGAAAASGALKKAGCSPKQPKAAEDPQLSARAAAAEEEAEARFAHPAAGRSAAAQSSTRAANPRLRRLAAAGFIILVLVFSLWTAARCFVPGIFSASSGRESSVSAAALSRRPPAGADSPLQNTGAFYADTQGRSDAEAEDAPKAGERPADHSPNPLNLSAASHAKGAALKASSRDDREDVPGAELTEDNVLAYLALKDQEEAGEAGSASRTEAPKSAAPKPAAKPAAREAGAPLEGRAPEAQAASRGLSGEAGKEAAGEAARDSAQVPAQDSARTAAGAAALHAARQGESSREQALEKRIQALEAALAKVSSLAEEKKPSARQEGKPEVQEEAQKKDAQKEAQKEKGQKDEADLAGQGRTQGALKAGAAASGKKKTEARKTSDKDGGKKKEADRQEKKAEKHTDKKAGKTAAGSRDQSQAERSKSGAKAPPKDRGQTLASHENLALKGWSIQGISSSRAILRDPKGQSWNMGAGEQSTSFMVHRIDAVKGLVYTSRGILQLKDRE